MNTRPLERQDLGELVRLHALCFGVEAWSEAQLEGSLSLVTTESRGYWNDGALIAFLLSQNLAEECEILTIGVHPDYRGQGIATKLIRELIHNQKKGALFLEVAADNKTARKLYESLGFTLFARRKGYYARAGEKIDALNYRLSLGG